MAQINLLTSDIKSHSQKGGIVAIIAKLLIVVLVLVVAAYIYAYIRVNQTAGAVETLKADITQSQASILADQGRQELLVRQAQLADVNNLITKHVYWSNLLKDLPKSTLQTARYQSITTQPDGTVALNVIVPTYEDLDRFLQVFDQDEYNKNFSTVKLLSLSKAQTGNVLRVSARIQLNYSAEALKKQP